MPLYSIQLLEPTRRSGSRRTWAFQLPMRKSKSCDPSRAGGGDSPANAQVNVSCRTPSQQIECNFMGDGCVLASGESGPSSFLGIMQVHPGLDVLPITETRFF